MYLSEHQAVGKGLCCSENPSLYRCVEIMVTTAGPMFVQGVHYIVCTVFKAIFVFTCMFCMLFPCVGTIFLCACKVRGSTGRVYGHI